MSPNGINSDGWTGGLQSSPWRQPMPPLQPPGPWRTREPFQWTPRRRALLQAVPAIFAPFMVALAFALVKISIRDLWIEAPDPWPWVILACLFGCGLYALAEFDILPRFVRWVALAWWLASLAAAIAGVVLVAVAHGAATEGPALRAVIGSVARHDRQSVYIFRLQDGSTAATYSQLSRPGDCFVVRRLAGRYGLSWLRIENASPPPRAGQLNWPIDPDACLAGAPLDSLRR